MDGLDRSVFSAAAISDEIAAQNAEIIARLKAGPDPWSLEPKVIRQARAEGRGPFPLPPKSPRAETIRIKGRHGPIALRIIPPAGGAVSGAFLHIHGGGWVLGATDHMDDRLERLADGLGLVVLSVDYRLAPENPYPMGPDDCEDAALWLVREGAAVLGAPFLAIGGESAGAHLAVVTLLRLRDRHGLTPFHAAILTAGCFDLGLTPSARKATGERLLLDRRDIEMFARHFLVRGGDLKDPDISPLYADLHDMPPALFSVGTRDALLDDSLFMAARWEAAGNVAELAVFAGGCHVFQAFPSALTEASLARIDQFLALQLTGTP
jgi:acetyl esterase/lipase